MNIKYAINTNTREHIRFDEESDYHIWKYIKFHKSGTCVWCIADADADGWISYNGTKCPVPRGASIEWKNVGSLGAFYRLTDELFDLN
jgi:hypothetical protein